MIKETSHFNRKSFCQKGKKSALSFLPLSFLSLTFLYSSIISLLILPPAFAQTSSLVKVAMIKSWQNGANHTLHCKVQSAHLFQISSVNSARLNWVSAPGTQVKKGQLIAKQNSYFLEREIEQLEIDIASASAEQDYAEKEFQRLNTLNKQLISPSLLNDMKRQLALATLVKARLNSQLNEANYRYSQLEHFAPQDGQVLELQAQPGQYLDIGENITRLQPANNKELMCELPLDKFRQNTALMDLVFSLGKDNKLTLLRTSRLVDEHSQTLRLYLASETSLQNTLMAGERLQVNVSYQSANLTRVPFDAFELTEKGYYVWRLDENNQVEKISVEVIATQKNHFIITSALKAGDLVVTIGKQGLTEKQKVTLTNKNLLVSELAS